MLTKEEIRFAKKELKRGRIRCAKCLKLLDPFNLIIRTDKNWSVIKPICKECAKEK